MKVIKSEIYPDVYINGSVEEKSENFRIISSGYVKTTIDDIDVISIEDWDIEDEVLYFRGDLVSKNPLLERFKREGYTTLMEELESLSQNLNPLVKHYEKRLKSIYDLKDIYFDLDLNEDERILLRLKRVIVKVKTKDDNQLKKDYCNSVFKTSFNDLDGFTTIKKLKKHFNKLNALYGGNIEPLLNRIKE